MTTPTTAQVRAWALASNIEVGRRGRLPAQLHEAFRRAHAPNMSRAKKAPAVSPAAKSGAATAPSLTKPARPSTARSRNAKPAPTAASRAAARAAAVLPVLQVTELDDRLTRLEQQFAQLAARFDAPLAAPGHPEFQAPTSASS